LLALPLLPEAVPPPGCPKCHDALDSFGDRFVTCRKNGTTRRHNALRDAWSHILVTWGIHHAKKVAVPNGDLPADILLIAWDKGTDVCVDLTITSPIGLDAYLNFQKGRWHLNDAEKEKRTKQIL